MIGVPARRDLNGVLGLPIAEADRALRGELLPLLAAEHGRVVDAGQELVDRARRRPALDAALLADALVDHAALPVGEDEPDEADEAAEGGVQPEALVEVWLQRLAARRLQELRPEQERANEEDVLRAVQEHVEEVHRHHPDIRVRLHAPDAQGDVRHEGADSGHQGADKVQRQHVGVVLQLLVAVAAGPRRGRLFDRRHHVQEEVQRPADSQQEHRRAHRYKLLRVVDRQALLSGPPSDPVARGEVVPRPAQAPSSSMSRRRRRTPYRVVARVEGGARLGPRIGGRLIHGHGQSRLHGV
mmetsp:Transcript_8947/g.23983  ORF Transcript_8947/g.23983 Transcript_8947/m.23983 type:complete len:299 (-) Transcript_8947:87-983(-)